MALFVKKIIHFGKQWRIFLALFRGLDDRIPKNLSSHELGWWPHATDLSPTTVVASRNPGLRIASGFLSKTTHKIGWTEFETILLYMLQVHHFSEGSPNYFSEGSPNYFSEGSPNYFSERSPNYFSEGSPNYFSEGSHPKGVVGGAFSTAVQIWWWAGGELPNILCLISNSTLSSSLSTKKSALSWDVPNMFVKNLTNSIHNHHHKALIIKLSQHALLQLSEFFEDISSCHIFIA